MTDRTPPPAQVPSEWYDRHYYLSNMEGGELFVETAGREVTPRHRKLLEFARVQPGERVLDAGCGRGELAIQAALAGATAVGIDYSADAIALAREAAAAHESEVRARLLFEVGDAAALEGLGDGFDVIFFVDVAEHLHPHELASALTKLRGLLRPTGRLVVHTAPNLLFYRYAYPAIRAAYPIIRRVFPAAAALAATKPNWQGDTLPRNPEEGQGYNERVHVNEQTPASLVRALREAGLTAKLHMVPFLRQVDGTALRALYRILALKPWAYVTSAEIVAVCRRAH